jgi:DNA-binding beta-propeller fold protein YncE
MTDIVYQIDGNTNRVVKTDTLGGGTTNLYVNPNTNIICVVEDLASRISIMDGSTNRVVKTVSAETA